MATRPPSELTSRYEEALAAGDVDGVLSAVMALQSRGHSRPCEAWLKQALEQMPEASPLAVRLLELQLRYRAWSEFDATAEVALDRHPDEADLHYTIGCGYESRGMWSAAARSFGRAADLLPDEIEPVLRQARSLRIERHGDDALRVLKAAVKRHSDVPELHAAIGYTLIELERPRDAVRRFEKALEHQPDGPTYLDDLAGALMLSERWEEAARTAMRSLETRKKNERAWTVFAIANNKLGDTKRADQGYRNAIRAAKDPSRAQGNYGLFLAKDPARLLEAVRMLKTALAAHADWTELDEKLAELLAR